MDIWFQLRRSARHLWPAVLSVGFVTYFGYHLVQGDRGLIVHAQLSRDVSRARAELQAVHAERERLQTRVNLLHPDHVDRDMLDERARRILGLVHPDEVVIMGK